MFNKSQAVNELTFKVGIVTALSKFNVLVPAQVPSMFGSKFGWAPLKELRAAAEGSYNMQHIFDTVGEARAFATNLGLVEFQIDRNHPAQAMNALHTIERPPAKEPAASGGFFGARRDPAELVAAA